MHRSVLILHRQNQTEGDNMYDIVLSQQQLAKARSGKFHGIDLGTSYTVVAEVDTDALSVSENGNLPVKLCNIKQTSPKAFDGAEYSEMVASIVAVDDNNKMYVGNKLYPLKADLQYTKDTNIFYHWKLDLGISKKPLYEDAVREDLDDASKVAGKILNYCRKSLIGDKNWENVVITVPASFQYAQRQDVLHAAQYAHIDVHDGMLFDEPTSAFLGYFNQLSIEEKQRILQNGTCKILVVDFGGGTIDLSTIAVRRENALSIGIDNVAISRYNNLGGQDLDMIIAEKYLLGQIADNYNIEASDSDILHQLMPQLAVMAEKLKKDLCCTIGALYDDPSKIQVNSSMVSTLENQKITIDDEEFNIPSVKLTSEDLYQVTSFIFQLDEYELCTTDKVVQSVPKVIHDVVEKSKWFLSDVQYVLLAGGSVRNPIFVKFLQESLPSATVWRPRNPDTLVATGAAIKSFYKYALGMELFHPICSDTIGVVTANSGFYPLIPAGQKLPAKVSLPAFSLQSDFQSNIEIPCCLNNEANVIAILKGEVRESIFKSDTLEVEMDMSQDKTLRVGLIARGSRMMEMSIDNPVAQSGMTEEERRIFVMEEKIRKAKQFGYRSDTKNTLRELIWEYYYLGNYKRCIQTAETYLKDCDNSDVYVLNIMYCAYLDLGQRKQAESCLDKALSLSPKNPTLVFNKSISIERNQGKQKALDYLQSNNSSDDDEINIRIALLSGELGDLSYAHQIQRQFNLGALQPKTYLESHLLKRVLDMVDTGNTYITIPDKHRKQHILTVDSDALLAVKGSIIKQ